MPTCPKCNGTCAKLISPGWYECETPDYADNLERDFCGHRYAAEPGAAANAPLCECGTFAIGQCMRCGGWVCGDHSDLADGRRYCGHHLDEARWNAEEAQAATIRTERERTRAWIRETLDTFVAVMAAAGCPGSYEFVIRVREQRRSWSGKGKGVRFKEVRTGVPAWTIAQHAKQLNPLATKYVIKFELLADGRLCQQDYRVETNGLSRSLGSFVEPGEWEDRLNALRDWITLDGAPIEPARTRRYTPSEWGAHAVADGVRRHLAATGVAWPRGAPALQPPPHSY